MAGGGYSKRGPGAPLGERTSSAGSGSSGELAATACWLEPSARLPGAILAWRRDPESGWQALVAAWVPADHVRPRSP